MESPRADEATVVCQFSSVDGVEIEGQIAVPLSATTAQLTELVNHLLQQSEIIPYSFYVNDTQISKDLAQTVKEAALSMETVLTVKYAPQALFRVRSITRCTADMPGHTEAVLCVCFSPNGRDLASGSGDKTVRLWDLNTQLPRATLNGHRSWVQQVCFSPCGKYLASAGTDNEVRVWDPSHTAAPPRVMRGHRKWVNAISWEPFHTTKPGVVRFVTGSADGTARVWNALSGQSIAVLSGHQSAIKDVRWGGRGIIYTASADRTIKLWDAETYQQIRTLVGHSHWINSLALSTDYALRTGPYDHKGQRPESDEAARAASRKKFEEAAAFGERLASASDDHTIYLWQENATKPQCRLTGHSRPVNHIAFSPDGRLLASASFDHSVRIWDAVAGRLFSTCRGHVQDVYRVAWAADSRLLVSGSKDSTLKCWSTDGTLRSDLPGHADSVFAVDWSPNSDYVASGGRDRVLKLWRH